jgi:hypothetical protein
MYNNMTATGLFFMEKISHVKGSLNISKLWEEGLFKR